MCICMLIFLNLQTTDYASAQLRGNMTLKCSPGGGCITEICIDDQSCDTIKSNSSNGTDLRDFLENKTKVTFIPREII
jgi:hypothetical protein